jgi:hypothetical protein
MAVACFAAAHVQAATTRFAPCPRLAEATRLPLRPGVRPLGGDIDGDGKRDRVTIHYAKWRKSNVRSC